MITAQFCVNGHTKQSAISRAFGISCISIKRSVKCYRLEGAGGFFKPRTKRGASVLTQDVICAIQHLLDEGDTTKAAADKSGIKPDTLRKAIYHGRLHKPKNTNAFVIGADHIPSSKSERVARDTLAHFGVGTTNEMGRVLARFGLLNGIKPAFENANDVSYGGVLLALPALMVCGLLRTTEKYFSLPQGYYSLETIFLLLAFMALSRLQTIESLRYCAPGEWGKLLGLDRIPEVKTLRGKIGHLSKHGDPYQWSESLCREWMDGQEDSAQALYIDGHVRVYSGSQTKLPRHYVARQRLCLRATTDYWVNAMDGQPFFVISKEVDPGLLNVLEKDIVPRLERDVPLQPSKKTLIEESLQHRFCLIFDREGYSPGFIKRMKEKRIACLTYHKHPQGDWRIGEFKQHEVVLASGEKVDMRLAERGFHLGKQVWVREIRKLTDSGHQTSMISTNYLADTGVLAATMFARWSQENFFAYMREHYGLDRVIDYQTEDIPDTTKVVNPQWRVIDGNIRGKSNTLHRLLVKFGSIELTVPIEKKQVKKYQKTKAEIKECIFASQQEIERLKEQRRKVKKHIKISELPIPDKFKRLQKDSKHFIDTIKMIAYRAETTMAYTIKENMSRPDDARALLRNLYKTEADILSNPENKTITVRIHHTANHCNDKIVRSLCKELNETKTIFPGTNLQIIYKMGSSDNPLCQDV